MEKLITGAAFKQMVLCAYEALSSEQKKINDLNVFPVPDGDTGTNMTLTMSAAATVLQAELSESIGEISSKAASALLRGARGNSGVILSIMFRGISKVFKGKDNCDASELAEALKAGSEAAYKAVMKPAEGTILTVARLASDAAVEAAAQDDDPRNVLIAAIFAAQKALANTTEQNPTLKRAGVVDAGGMGYIVILKAFLEFLQGKRSFGGVVKISEIDEEEHTDFSVFGTEEIEFAYDTVYIMNKIPDAPDLDLLREYLTSIGDSLVISEDDDVFKVHVHTNVPGQAITESQKYGVLEICKIENMRTQHEALTNNASAPAPAEEPEFAEAEKECGFVSVCAGDGFKELFFELGCDRVVTGGQTMNPSTEDILKEVNKTPASTVFVFPNNKNIIMAAEQCDALTEKKVIVIPTTTVPQGIACLMNGDLTSSADELKEILPTLCADVKTISVTYAARNSNFDGYEIKEGEYLALLEGKLIGSFPSVEEAASVILGKIEELNPGYVTVYYGCDVSAEDAESFAGMLSGDDADYDIAPVSGGQPVYYYLISVE